MIRSPILAPGLMARTYIDGLHVSLAHSRADCVRLRQTANGGQGGRRVDSACGVPGGYAEEGKCSVDYHLPLHQLTPGLLVCEPVGKQAPVAWWRGIPQDGRR